MDGVSAVQIIETLELQPHPEGGHFKETFRDEADASTAIYYLLCSGEPSHWHRVHGSAEVWHYYAGDPLALSVSSNGDDVESMTLGPNLQTGERPQFVVPAGWWQSARTVGQWTLVGCTVAPGFKFDKFEMAPTDWHPTSVG